MDQIVWHFDGCSIINYCTKHNTTEFVYTDAEGLRCHQTGCDESMWVEFVCDPLKLSTAQEKAEEISCEATNA